MMIRLNWKEFVQAAREQLARLNPQFSLGEPKFKKDHGCYDGIGDAYDLPDFVDLEVSGDIKPFQCGTGEMGTFFWSKNSNPETFPEITPVPIDPEVDRIDFFIKGPDGEYIPWKPTEGQFQMLSIWGFPTRVPGKGAEDQKYRPQQDSSNTDPRGIPL